MTHEMQIQRANLPTAQEVPGLAESDCLPYVVMGFGMTREVQEGQTQPGNFILRDFQNPAIIGKQFTAFMLSWRWRASEFDESSLLSTVFDPNDPEYSRIRTAKDKGYKHGKEALLYLFDYARYATYHCGGGLDRATGQMAFKQQDDDQAQQTKQTFKEQMTEDQDPIELQKRVWIGGFIGQAVICTVDGEGKHFMAKSDDGRKTKVIPWKPKFTYFPREEWTQKYKLPNEEEANAQLQKFLNPPQAETAEPEEEGRPR